MNAARALAIAGALAMGGVLVYGFTVGDFAGEGAALLAMPWGIVSLVDLYVGFALFSGWIVFREGLRPLTLLWVALVMVLGFFAASLYVWIALERSRGEWGRFWMGRRWGGGGKEAL